MDVRCGGMRMKKDLAVGERSGWVDTVVMRFYGGGLNEEGWD